MLKQRLAIQLTFILLLTTGSIAQAGIITVYTQTEITSIQSDTDGVWAANGIAVGSVFDGNFTYDDTTTNLNSATGNYDNWLMNSFSMNIPGGSSFVPAGISASVTATDSWAAVATYTLAGSSGNAWINFAMSGDLGIDISDVDAGLDNLIIGPPLLDVWVPGSFLRYARSGGGIDIAYASTIYSLSPLSSVPEPSLFLLMSIGLAGLSLRRQKQL